MTEIAIPKALPDCELLRVLAYKVSQRRDIDFNFFARLDELRERVSGEVRQINNLFPEYTPHDEQYHLKRLFHVADTVLTRIRLEEMHSAELFVLAIALYGHDWGMAVSNAEKQYIVSEKLPKGTKAGGLWVLGDERDRFAKFAREQRLIVERDSHLKEAPIDVEIWREYVRQTHALRSSKRVRRFFERINGGVAEGASRVCLGHWVDFEDLQDYRLYPSDFSILRESVNLRALAVYLRLVDLLDLSEDRTPYVMWKFVAPRDPRSKMEWAKHRALRPVTCPRYQQGRIIQVDGSTDDHDVYAALEDLRIRCEEQLRGCNDVLARMNDPRHKLDLYHIDWRVAARGFTPVSVQFEFNRERMFEILSDEIYRSDPYVFLRELLQNSIDAIRMRREILKRRAVDPGNVGVIHVTVEHADCGDAIVTWRDDGIGMDEYILRNYLAVAGKSYYRSSDFERVGLKMDPISRFGIGILSCFMVADRVEIETYKDPYLSPTGQPLSIVIPAIRRQFRIERRPEEATQVGTTVRVFVEGKKIGTDDGKTPLEPLDITAYLSMVAGFVEFPIVITEGDRKTIVLHPKQDAQVARKRFGKAFQVQQLDLGYPWSKAIPSQVLPAARELLQEKSYDIASDLGLKDYDGVVAYLVPIEGRVDLGLSPSQFGSGADVIIRGRAEQAVRSLYHRDSWDGYSPAQAGMSPSSRCADTYAVYRDGILLPAASPPKTLWRPYIFRGVLPVPRVVINIPKSKVPRVDLARTHALAEPEGWDSPVWHAHHVHLFETSLKGLLRQDPAERWYQLGRCIAFHHLDVDKLWELFPHDRWPLLFVEPGGHLGASEWQEVAAGAIYLGPQLLDYEIKEMLSCVCLGQKQYEGPLLQWVGERFVGVTDSLLPSPSLSVALTAACEVPLAPIEKCHRVAAARFLCPPWHVGPPLVQTVWLPREAGKKPPSIQAVLEKALENPALLDPLECRDLFTLENIFPRVVPFSQPFEQSFAYGWKLINLRHRCTQVLLSLLARLALARRSESMSEDRIRRFDDGVADLRRWSCEFEPGLIIRCLQDILVLASDFKFMDIGEIKGVLPTPDEFISGSFDEPAARRRLAKGGRIRPFGRPLT